MDYFFAQIEERENPRFKGLPLVIGADPKGGSGRGVVSTCNYEARKFGIKSGMPISRSYKLNPKAIYLPVNMNLYRKVSDAIFLLVGKYSQKMERVALDEAYIDLTGLPKGYGGALVLAKEMKKKIYEKEKLTCTVGIAENKMIAKIACEEVKPDGIKVVMSKDSESFILKMGVEKIPGIGPKSRKIIENFLKKRDVSIEEAKKINKEDLVFLFGKRGGEFFDKFRGKDESPVNEKKEAKSIGREYTFQEDVRDSKKIIKVFKSLISLVCRELKEKDLRIKSVVVVCRFEDFETHTRQTSFSEENYSQASLYKKSIPLLLRFLTESNKKVRLIGFRVIVD